MKLLLVAILAVMLLLVFMSRSLESGLDGIISIPLPESATEVPAAGSGGAPRKTAAPRATSSNPSGFIGPSGPPGIKGPSGPPPGSNP